MRLLVKKQHLNLNPRLMSQIFFELLGYRFKQLTQTIEFVSSKKFCNRYEKPTKHFRLQSFHVLKMADGKVDRFMSLNEKNHVRCHFKYDHLSAVLTRKRFVAFRIS